ncbi:PPOX class F420-dependent oxidoreductase [Streptomyces sp. ISL-11]|uniref:PPOX class F420-dependent oxidoreductase n=1 Tax=Streptomyces sp. ISL-11 TaxID=2819174 RepID=UPI001BE6CD32|nr:PPOX class F420-dependent oxidoreductase [Streptomyces sp. ISL-11]MBT2384481.1 PPOX class F420-dependent oxidoreductase [Streptomyces sp. ISL-11]
MSDPLDSRTAAVTLAPFVEQKTVLLTTFRRDGTPVGTPVNLAVEGDRAYFRTYDASWKAKRLRREPEVTVAPSTVRGAPTGPAITGRARLLDGEEAHHAARLMARKHPVLHGVLVPVVHRARRYRTLHYELTPTG